jgi:arginyl-tRNA synthetase
MEIIKANIIEAIKELGLEVSESDVAVERPSDDRFGDFSTNIAMIVAKKINGNAEELARNIRTKLEAISDKTNIIEKIEVVGGFINFFLKIEYLVKRAELLNYEIELKNEMGKHGEGRTVVIDYSAPNIAKPFGIGHLRSTDIGQAILNIYSFLGWKTIGDNHLGDWGTQFGKLIVAIKRWGDKPVEKMEISDLERLYVKFHQEAEKDPSLEEEGREWFAKLENKDPEARKIWQQCIDLSLKEFDRVYKLLGVKIDVAHGESFYEDMLGQIIEEIKNKGIARESQGALIVEFDDMPPAMIQKSNKTTTYMTRDLATIKYRMREWEPELMVYEVGADQTLHFRQLFKIAQMLGWTPNTQLVHVAHGLIRWPSGKFSTRKGDTIHLEEVIDKAIEEAKKLAENSQVVLEMKKEEREEVIKSVAIGAIKFNDLSADPRKDIIFDWDKVMNLEGDSGPYLQYTYARAISVLARTSVKEQKNIGDIPEINGEEYQLVRELSKFEDKVTEAARRFSPNVIAEYLLKVARIFNEFYAKHRIIDQAEEDWRVFLTKSTASLLGRGMKLIGINPVERM